MPKQNRSIPEATISYTSGLAVAQEVTRGGLVLGYMCRLTGQLTCTGANNTAANTKRGDGLAAMRRVRVRMNSTEIVYDLDAPGIIADNWYSLGKLPRDVNGTIGDGTTANPAIDISFVIPFELPRRKVPVPMDTALDTRATRMSKLEVEVEWGSFTDVNGAATGWTVNPQLQVISIAAFNVEEDLAVGYLRRYKISQTLAATNPRETIRLPTAHTYLGLILNTTHTPANIADSTAVAARVKLQTNGNVFEDWIPSILHDAYGRIWHGREGVQDEFYNSTQFNLRAYYPIEIPYDGNLREMLQAASLAELVLEIDSTVGTGATANNVYVQQYVPPLVRAA